MEDKIKKNEFPELSEDTAEKLLANVFDSCGFEPNTIPLKNLAVYSEYRRERYIVQKVLVAFMIVLFCLLPFCFISPEFTLVRTSPSGSASPTYEIRIINSFPVSSVIASVDGKPLRVYEKDSKTYYVNPTTNGEMLVKVTLLNRQYTVKSLSLSGVDGEAPVLLSQKKYDDRLYLYLSDIGFGIDWDGIYAETTNGDETVSPLYWDEDDSYVVFSFPEEDVNIYIPDLKGNTLHLALTVD